MILLRGMSKGGLYFMRKTMTDREKYEYVRLNLPDFRWQLHMSQKKFAKEVGVHWQTICHFETGRHHLRTDTYFDILDYLATKGFII